MKLIIKSYSEIINPKPYLVIDNVKCIPRIGEQITYIKPGYNNITICPVSEVIYDVDFSSVTCYVND